MSKQNKEILHQMKKTFYSECDLYIDWMGYPITNENYPTYHHIIKKETLGSLEATVDNGAYLGKKSHELLHRIEQNNLDLYNRWNYLFKIINNGKSYPNYENIINIYQLREESEQYNINNKRL